jgi:uncharacterized lipoprotein
MFRYPQHLLLIGLAICLSGCGALFGKHNFVKQHETEYLRSTATPALQLPPNANPSSIGDDYFIPPVAGATPTQPIALLPPGSLAEKITRGEVSATVLKTKKITSVTRPANTLNDTQRPTLTLEQNTAQLWHKIGSSLQRVDYAIANQNSSTGIYYLLDTPSTNGKIKKDTPIYQLHISDTKDNVAQAYVTDNNNNPMAADVAQRILNDLRDALAGKTPSRAARWLKGLF